MPPLSIQIIFIETIDHKTFQAPAKLLEYLILFKPVNVSS